MSSNGQLKPKDFINWSFSIRHVQLYNLPHKLLRKYLSGLSSACETVMFAQTFTKIRANLLGSRRNKQNYFLTRQGFWNWGTGEKHLSGIRFTFSAYWSVKDIPLYVFNCSVVWDILVCNYIMYYKFSIKIIIIINNNIVYFLF